MMSSSNKLRLKERFVDALLWPVKVVRKIRAAVIGIAKFGWRKLFRRFWKFQEPSWKLSATERLVTPPSQMSAGSWFNPIYWIVWIFKFCFSWISSRPYGNLGPAIPAVAVSLVVGAVAYWDRYEGMGWRNNNYRRMFEELVREERFESAELVAKRLSHAFPNDLNLQYQKATLSEKLGNEDQARSRMMELVVDHQFGPAAEWLIKTNYSLIDLAKWDQAKHQQFQALVAVALQKLRNPQLANIKLTMSSYLSQMGAHREAIKLLQEVSLVYPEVSVTGLSIAYQMKDDQLAKDFARSAEAYLLRKIAESPNSLQQRLDLAKALVIQEREQDAATSLREGMNALSSDPKATEKLQEATGEVLVFFVNRLAKKGSPRESLLQRLNVINNAIKIAPNNPKVVNAMIDIVLECESDKEQQIVALRNALVQGANGTAPEAVHFIVGTLDLLAGRVESGLSHLEIAKSSGLNTPGILNNLAMAIVENSKKDDLPRALELSNAAIKAMPDHPYMRDTRGRVLLMMGKPSEAILDLEVALQAPELAADVHRLLAEAYTGLNQNELASEHMKQFEALSKTKN